MMGRIILLWFLMTKTVSFPLLYQSKNADFSNGLMKILLQGQLELKFPNVSKECSRDFKSFTKGLTSAELWAWQMVDAYGKPGSGISYGNTIWPGSFSLCNSVQNMNASIRGQYCLLSTQTSFRPLKIAICVPHSCKLSDLSTVFSENVKVTCIPANRDLKTDAGAIIALAFCFFIGLLLITATAYDIYLRRSASKLHNKSESFHNLENSGKCKEHKCCKVNHTGGKILLCFSLQTNASQLFTITKTNLPCLNAIRVLSLIWIIYSHTHAAGLRFSDNALQAIAKEETVLGTIIKQGEFAVDSFFVLSGLLVTYVYLKNKEKGRRISLVNFYLLRYWRLTPVYAAVLFLLPMNLQLYFLNGPLWSINEKLQEECRKNWWKHLLYINNVVSDLECMGHTWYLATDTQFYILSPLILIFLKRHVKISAVIGGCLIVINWICSYVVVNEYNIQAKLDYLNGTLVREHQEKFYFMPYIRITPYIIGMACGYFLHTRDCFLKLSKKYVRVGWFVAIKIMFWVIFITYLFDMPREVQVLYLMFARSLWAIALVWIICSCCTGRASVVNGLLSFDFWQPLARLTYSAYLIHVSVIRLSFLGSDVVVHLSYFQLTSIFVVSTVYCFVAAVVFYLSFEVPLLMLEKLLLKPSYKNN